MCMCVVKGGNANLYLYKPEIMTQSIFSEQFILFQMRLLETPTAYSTIVLTLLH